MKKQIVFTKSEPQNIAADFFIGNTHIQISDDYCRNKSQQEIERILDNISEIALERLAPNLYAVQSDIIST